MRFGEPTYDEMMIGWVDYTVDSERLKRPPPWTSAADPRNSPEPRRPHHGRLSVTLIGGSVFVAALLMAGPGLMSTGLRLGSAK